MKTLLTFLFCLITLAANSQLTEKDKELIKEMAKDHVNLTIDKNILESKVKNLTDENRSLKFKVDLYKQLTDEMNEAINTLQKKPSFHDTRYQTHYANQIFERDVYVKGNLFVIVGRDTLKVVVRGEKDPNTFYLPE